MLSCTVRLALWACSKCTAYQKSGWHPGEDPQVQARRQHPWKTTCRVQSSQNLGCHLESAAMTACRLNLQPQVSHSATVRHSSRHQQGPCLHQGYQGMRWPGRVMSGTGLRLGVNGLPLRQGSTERIACKVQGLQGAHVLPLCGQGTCNGACTRLHQRRCKGATSSMRSRPKRLKPPSANHEGGSSSADERAASMTGVLACRGERYERHWFCE